MAHYAFIGVDNIVDDVIVGFGENETVDGVSDWEAYYGAFRGQVCLRTSYNTHGGIHYTDGEPSEDQSKALRYNYAGLGFTYDADRDAFIPPQPYPSWVLDEATCLWEAPSPYPEDGEYFWDEPTASWIEYEQSS
jgi:hypothetical protein